MEPEKLKKLFSFKNKADAHKYAENELEVSLSDLCGLITTCSQDEFSHEAKHYSWQSPNIQLTQKDKDEIADMSKFPSKAMAKLQQGFEKFKDTRKEISAHIFDKNEEWHMFFWVGADILGKEGGKVWGSIPHIHYTSSYYGHTRENAWEKVKSNKIESMPKAHVKLI